MEHARDRSFRPLVLFGHHLMVQGINVDNAWLAQFDAMLGPSFQSEAEANAATVLTVERAEGNQWSISDGQIATLTHDPAVALREVEWQAFAAAVRHAPYALVAHAGAVVRDGRAILLPAPSGSGKTTLTLALQARGWAPLTDDLCALTVRDGLVYALPCQRCCHLSAPSQAILAKHGVALRGPIADQPEYFRPTHWGDAAPVQEIIAPAYAPDAVCALTPFTQAETAALLITASFEQDGQPMRARWGAAIHLAIQARGWRLTYARLEDAFAAIEQIVR